VTRPSRSARVKSSAPTTDPPRADALLAAAFADFARDGDAYADLHHEYLGVTQPAPDTPTCAQWPDAFTGHLTLRLGFITEVPLHTVDASGNHVGFEADLAKELVRRINAHYPKADVTLEWMPVNVTLPVGPAKNSTAVNALAADVAAAGGSISLAPSGTEPHFRMADILGLTKMVAENPSVGTLLDVNPRTDFQPKSTFALAGVT
jgi:hypothetical protein